MPGPKPNPSKPGSRHRQRIGRSTLVVLPADGCDLPVPPLPRGREWSKHERALWRQLWRSPQAVMWDESFAPAVAAYVVHTTAVLVGTAPAWQASEARHLGDRLGLTPAGLVALGWAIEGAEPAADPVPLHVVDGRGAS